MMYEYQTTFADFMAAQKLFRTLTLKRRIGFFFWIWVMPVIGVAALLLFAWDISMNHFRLLTPILAGLCSATATLGILSAIMRPFQMRKLYNKMKNGRPDDAPLAVGIENGDLVARVPDISEGRFKRAAVVSIAENDQIMLVCVTKKTFLMVPKTMLPESAFVELREWYGTRISRPA